MLKKILVALSIIASLSGCTSLLNTSEEKKPKINTEKSPVQLAKVTNNSEQASPEVTPENNALGSPSPEATPQNNVSVSSSPEATTENNIQVSSTPQATPNNSNQTILAYNPELQGRLITEPDIFYEKLRILSEKFVKDNFETTDDFKQRMRREIKSFENTESLSYTNDVFVIRIPSKVDINANNYNYNADKRTLTITSDRVYYRNTEVSGEILDQAGNTTTNIILNPFFPSKVTQAELDDFSLNTRHKFEDSNILISNLDPYYAKELVVQNRISYDINFKYPLVQNRNIIGKLVNLKVIDNQTGKVLWSLN